VALSTRVVAVYHGYGGKADVCFAIDEFAEMVHPRDGHPKIFAMIDAYLDESGIHDGAAVCVVAGYFAGRGQWRKFEKAWRRVLDDFGMPLEEFHAKDLVKKDDPKYKELLDSLALLIARFAEKVHPISAAIIVEEFYSFSLDDRKFMTGATLRNNKLVGSGSPDKPYYIPFQHCLKRVTEYAPVGGKVHFFFGLGHTFSGYALSLFEQAKADKYTPRRECLGDIDFPEAKQTPQLQAADFLVHLSYLYALKMIKYNSWGTIQPTGPLRYALAGTMREEDHVYQNRRALEQTITKGMPEFYKRIQESEST